MTEEVVQHHEHETVELGQFVCVARDEHSQ
jgi:hypothetical protein